MEVKKSAFMVLVENPIRRRQFGRPRYKLGIILKWNLNRIGGLGLDSFDVGYVTSSVSYCTM
jgi:hypothetical protein